jgi:hypothetical protein
VEQMWNLTMITIYYLGYTYHYMCNSCMGNRIPICHVQLLCPLLDWKTNMSNYINTTDVTRGGGTAHPSGTPLSSPLVFSWVRVTLSLVLCVCFVDRCLYFIFWPLCCLFFFDIRILITPLLSSNSSYIEYLQLNVVFEVGYSDAIIFNKLLC